jgi:hypothetical protein
MATLQQQIAEAFLTKLAESKDIAPAMVEELRSLLTSGKKPKPDDIMKIFSAPPGGDLK